MTAVFSAGTGRRWGAPAVPQLAFIALAAAAWAWTIRSAHRMGNGPGTVGLGWESFLGVWAVMMVAMMLPTVSGELPVVVRRRLARAFEFAAGYLSVWTVLGVAAYLATVGAAHLVAPDPRAATAVAALVFTACGLYQFTPAKRAALARCRPDIEDTSLASDEPVLATLARGVQQARWCVASSWLLMAAIIPVGVMNVPAMIAIFLAMCGERTQALSDNARPLVGVASLAMAATTLFHPQLAAGLHGPATHMTM